MRDKYECCARCGIPFYRHPYYDPRYDKHGHHFLTILNKKGKKRKI